jgi:hypothetical protein
MVTAGCGRAKAMRSIRLPRDESGFELWSHHPFRSWPRRPRDRSRSARRESPSLLEGGPRVRVRLPPAVSPRPIPARHLPATGGGRNSSNPLSSGDESGELRFCCGPPIRGSRWWMRDQPINKRRAGALPLYSSKQDRRPRKSGNLGSTRAQHLHAEPSLFFTAVNAFAFQAIACACYVACDGAYSLPSRSWIRPARRWRCTAIPTWFGRSLGHAR